VLLAPEKRGDTIRKCMTRVRLGIDEGRERGDPGLAPAGQSTQMIVVADGSSDREILTSSETLYGSYGLKRICYSAFGTIPDSNARLPLKDAVDAGESALSGRLDDAVLSFLGGRG
jgi:predicted DNA-binding helix-hairpin-helix protein